VSTPLASAPATLQARVLGAYLLVGVLFGVVLTKGELVSWFRIEEALRFKGPYLYEVFASALAVAVPGFALLKRRRLHALTGEPIVIVPQPLGRPVRYIAGGALFGVGWGMLGACPGPIFALIGAGFGVMAAALGGAVAGTWAYARLQPRLPH
jgi:uncharacterized membrane protein YedE/YeeE